MCKGEINGKGFYWSFSSFFSYDDRPPFQIAPTKKTICFFLMQQQSTIPFSSKLVTLLTSIEENKNNNNDVLCVMVPIVRNLNDHNNITVALSQGFENSSS